MNVKFYTDEYITEVAKDFFRLVYDKNARFTMEIEFDTVEERRLNNKSKFTQIIKSVKLEVI